MDFEQGSVIIPLYLNELDSLLVKQALHPPSSASVENQTIINEILNESLAIDANFDPINLDLFMDEIKFVPDVVPQQSTSHFIHS